MKGADTMNIQTDTMNIQTDKIERQTDKIERQVMNLLSYWAARRRDTGFIFIEHLPKDANWESCQEVILISGRRFNIIYTQIGQTIWTKVLVQEQGSGRMHAVQAPSQKSQGPSQKSKVPSPKVLSS